MNKCLYTNWKQKLLLFILTKIMFNINNALDMLNKESIRVFNLIVHPLYLNIKRTYTLC